jgi:two-component system, OmpR family, sensor histidine kinase PhoQ
MSCGWHPDWGGTSDSRRSADTFRSRDDKGLDPRGRLVLSSLRARVTWAAALVLLVFIVLTSLALEQAFHASARSAREERLLGQIYLLMAAADTEADGLTLPRDLAEARFSQIESGLYAQVADARGEPEWRSLSALGLEIPFVARLGPGVRHFQEARDSRGRAYFVEGFGVTWSIGPSPRDYTFSVAEDLGPYQEELARFRVSLFGWLGALSLLLMVALLAALHWGLAPLRRVAEEVAAVEAGRQERLRGVYPAELRALTDNLNALLAHGAARQARLGNALADLAHSLKTPLAVMRGALDGHPGPPSEGLPQDQSTQACLEEQIRRMDEIVIYQLERARGRPAATLSRPIRLTPTVERLLTTLAKLHSDRAVTVERELEPGLGFRGAEGDLLEVVGNLLDNAFKWCRTRVRVGAKRESGLLVIWVEDDGPGITPEQARGLGERGARVDLSTPGHGIGLAVAREICEAYEGDLAIATSPLGGASVCARLGA